MTAPVPPEAITIAAQAINEALPGGLILDDGPAYRAAERALEAAAPILRNHWAAELDACHVTLATIRQHAETVQAGNSGYARAMRNVLRILDMHGKPEHEPVSFGGDQ